MKVQKQVVYYYAISFWMVLGFPSSEIKSSLVSAQQKDVVVLQNFSKTIGTALYQKYNLFVFCGCHLIALSATGFIVKQDTY